MTSISSYHRLLSVIITVCIGLIIYSCANKSQGPTGGPKDETPPKIIKTIPLNAALNFKKKQVQIYFDENISVENPAENILISPPQQKQPTVKGNGRIVTVDFEQNLIDSTTYTINFGNSIVDLNEKNPLENYRFSFSTGNEIDTLKISGIVINAEDLNPMSKVLVGIYREHNDSVFFQKPFLRIGKTDEHGRFVIDNVKAGVYKVFALDDTNKDYFFQPGEGVAFIDSLVTPTFRIEEMKDTVWEDSIHVDSIRTYMGTRFLPDNIVMKFFKENKKRQYFVKSERKTEQTFQLFFNTKQTELPVLKALNFDWKGKIMHQNDKNSDSLIFKTKDSVKPKLDSLQSSWEGKYMLQKNQTLDSLTYWIMDTIISKIDTLQFSMSYFKTDSAYQLVPQTDTINVFMRKARENPKAKKLESQPKIEFYKFNHNASGNFEVYNPIILKFDSPLAEVDLSKIKLLEKIDTVFKDLPIKWIQADSSKMQYNINYKFEPEKSYELKIDSAAFRNIYNLNSDKSSGQFKVKSLDEYSSIKMLLSKFDSLVVFQVLDTKDVVLSTKPASPKGTHFEYLKPGDYYLRAFIDSNRNGVWDTGDLSKKLQPETVYYYNKKLSLRANWEFEETWDLGSVPLLEQKPAELKKDNKRK